MPLLVRAEDFGAAPFEWLQTILVEKRPTVVVGSVTNPVAATLLHLLWVVGFPVTTVTEWVGDTSDVSFSPPRIVPPIVGRVADPAWDSFLRSRAMFFAEAPEEVEIDDIHMVRLAVVSASQWEEEMHSWDTLFIILVDVEDEDKVPTPAHAIYVVPSLLLLPLSRPAVGQFNCIEIFTQPPSLRPFREMLETLAFVRWEARDTLGAILDPRLISPRHLEEFRETLSYLKIPQVSYDEGGKYKAIILPIDPHYPPYTVKDEILRLLLSMVHIFTNAWGLSYLQPFCYTTSGVGSSLSQCIEAFVQFGKFYSIDDKNRLLTDWVAQVQAITVEGFCFKVLEKAYKSACSIWPHLSQLPLLG